MVVGTTVDMVVVGRIAGRIVAVDRVVGSFAADTVVHTENLLVAAADTVGYSLADTVLVSVEDTKVDHKVVEDMEDGFVEGVVVAVGSMEGHKVVAGRLLGGPGIGRPWSNASNDTIDGQN
jgi:hypothetical protein